MEEAMKDCCQIEDNLIPTEIDGNFILVCRVCGCRHFNLDADVGKYGSEIY
jgi:hypothetical protein